MRNWRSDGDDATQLLADAEELAAKEPSDATHTHEIICADCDRDSDANAPPSDE